MSQKNKNWYLNNTKSENIITNWVEKVAKKPASKLQKETASKIGKNKVMLKNINTNECIRIDRNEASTYDKTIWRNPAALKQKKETCIHCGLTTVSGNIKRWHNDKCKRKDYEN